MAVGPNKSPEITSIRIADRVDQSGSLPKGPDPQPSDSALKLAAKLRAAASTKERVFLFCGVAGREGISDTALTVARAMAQDSPDAVLLVDADLRYPSIHSLLDIPATPGFSELAHTGMIDPNSIYVSGQLAVMPAGGTPDAPATCFSEGYHAAFETLRRKYRWIVVAGAPVLAGADADLIAAHTDGVVLVVSAGTNRKRDLLAAKRDLDGVHARVFGAVLYRP